MSDDEPQHPAADNTERLLKKALTRSLTKETAVANPPPPARQPMGLQHLTVERLVAAVLAVVLGGGAGLSLSGEPADYATVKVQAAKVVGLEARLDSMDKKLRDGLDASTKRINDSRDAVTERIDRLIEAVNRRPPPR